MTPEEIRILRAMTPEQKLAVVREKKRHGETVLFVGDGINDAAAMAESDISIAVGHEGLTREVADIEWPVLITTGDNVLLTPAALQDFHRFATERNVDAAAMFARKEDILAAHPEGQPRFWKFRDGEFSGCNTFWLKDRAALSVAEIFRGGGQFLKFPKRFVGAFGLSNLIGFQLRLFDTERMLARVSRRFGKQVKVRIAENGELAIDVDTEFSHSVAERLLRKRGVTG